MSFTDVVKQILVSKNEPLTPQEIREKIKADYPEFYGTESHLNNVQKGHYKNLDHALLAQIYSLVKTNDSFFCDRNSRPMKVSLMDELEEETPSMEDFEKDEGMVYVLKTNTFTKNGQEIIKIGFTTQDIKKRLNQLYTTGVPFEFQVHKTYYTRYYIELEQALHRLLTPFKINKSREFFTENAMPYIEKIVEIHQSIEKNEEAN